MQPAEMILDKQVVPAQFTLLRDFQGDAVPDAPGCAIPLSCWLALRERGADVRQAGVIVEGSDSVAPLQDVLGDVPFVALHLPTFRDGRIYSHARRLRGIWGYKGTILAFGDVLRDQLVYLSRVGVNAFYMRDGSDLRASLAAFSLYKRFYQYNDDQAA